jgi:tetratricopeptide (TPR) repeat protein
MYERAIQIDPQYAQAYAGIADCHSFLYMYSDSSRDHQLRALEASEKALELDPDSAEGHASRALALSVAAKHGEAEEEFKTAIQLDPKLFEAYYFYARDCLSQGEYAKAAQLFEQASSVRPEDYQAPMFLAQALEGMGTPPEQVKYLLRQTVANVETHVKLNPDDPRALYLGAGALLQLGQQEKGLRWARQALAIDPNEPNVLYNVACAFARVEPEEALDLVERAVANGFRYKAWLEHDTDFDSLRDQPRFKALLASME